MPVLRAALHVCFAMKLLLSIGLELLIPVRQPNLLQQMFRHDLSSHSGVEGIADAVADEVEADHGGQNGNTGEG